MWITHYHSFNTDNLLCACPCPTDKLKTEGSQRAISDPYTNGDEGEPDKFKTEIPEEVTSCPHTLDEEGKLKPSEKPKTATDPHVGKIRKEAEQWTVIEEVIDKGWQNVLTRAVASA